ncbi:MAG: amino acid adenylation domain-containing protein [Candidatus Aminicenantes bacterium]|nr:amino acid adenylation domain-containing protein [Candidatus Aminicenantes bacterium]
MKHKTVQAQLQEVFNKSGNDIAIQCGSRKKTYAEFHRETDYMANRLLEKGIEKETFVGLLIEDRVDFITAMIAVLKAGCVFVPLEPAFPDKRLEEMIKSVDISLTISDRVNLNRFSAAACAETPHSRLEKVEFIRAADLSAPAGETPAEDSPFYREPQVEYSEDDRVYVYYTSGTSGKPKAVLGKNKGLIHFILWEIDTFAVDGNSRFSQLITPGFDPFLRDIFVPLCAGGRICIPEDKSIIIDAPKLIDWVDKSGIYLIHCVPAQFRILSSAKLTADIFKSLKYILLAGEKINPPDLAEWYGIFDERIQLVNMYGPTETTLAKVFYLIKKADVNRERIPIGKPIRGARVVIFDKDMHVCDQLVSGEIYIRTPYRSFGYCNDPELNHEKFIPNPINEDPLDILYKTGDLGRFLPGGNVDILGRTDRQVKIRGMRIELEEVESALVRLPRVKEAVVVKREISNNNEVLCAYITAQEDAPAGNPGQTLSAEVKKHLPSQLPPYMIPARFVELDKLPRKPNAKVDYDGLPDPFKEEAEYIAPRGDVEKKLVEVWCDILGIEKVGRTNSFPEVGGNSLNIMTLVSRLRREFDIKVSLADIFGNQTIEEQAELIRYFRETGEFELLLGQLECVVRLNLIKSDRNIFIIHPRDPLVLLYRELAGALQGDFNVFGIQSKGLLNKAKLPDTMQEMLDDYVSQIKRIQPQGPYYIAGYCVGCIIAYETARCLEDLDDEVERLIMIDSPAFLSKAVIRIIRTVERLAPQQEGRYKSLKEKMARPLESFAAESKVSHSYSAQWMERRKDAVSENNNEIIRKYNPVRIIDSPVLVIKAEHSEHENFALKRWKKMTAGRVESVESPGDHSTIIRGDNALKLAGIIAGLKKINN